MLTDIIPAKHRRRLYALVSLAAVVFGAWQASDGNWQVFVGSLITAATTALAAGNVKPNPTLLDVHAKATETNDQLRLLIKQTESIGPDMGNAVAEALNKGATGGGRAGGSKAPKR